jgi:hypothetical protein
MAQTRRPPASRGDVTGRQKVKSETELAKEQSEAAKQMALVAAAENAAKHTEVVDLTGAMPSVVEDQEFEEQDGTPIEVTAEDEVIAEVVAKAGPQPKGGQAAEVVEQGPVTVVQNDKVKIRAFYDLEDVTVGYPSTYTFEAGRKYIVPRNVAFHLAERELVEVLS